MSEPQPTPVGAAEIQTLAELRDAARRLGAKRLHWNDRECVRIRGLRLSADFERSLRDRGLLRPVDGGHIVVRALVC
jgi:hypothetical protein